MATKSTFGVLIYASHALGWDCLQREVVYETDFLLIVCSRN